MNADHQEIIAKSGVVKELYQRQQAKPLLSANNQDDEDTRTEYSRGCTTVCIRYAADVNNMTIYQ